MRILIIGDADSIWIKSIIENTLLPFGDDVEILSYNNRIFADYYMKNHIKVHIAKSYKGNLRIFNGIRNIKVLIDKYDIVHVHFASILNLAMIPFAKAQNPKIVVSYWGSDILRIKRKSLICDFLLGLCDIITISTKEMYNKFKMLYGIKHLTKVKLTHFGSNVINQIDNVKQIGKIKEKYNISDDKVIISVGYNADPAQQHLKVMEVMDHLSEEDKRRIHLLFRITYNKKSQEYIDELKAVVYNSGCSNTFIEDYISEDDVAEITAITDIFIHAQISDARSACVCEHLYAGCLVFNPDWISYSDFDSNIFYLKYKNFEELNNLINSNICKKDFSQYVERLRRNKKLICKITSWKSFTPGWRKTYELK